MHCYLYIQLSVNCHTTKTLNKTYIFNLLKHHLKIALLLKYRVQYQPFRPLQSLPDFYGQQSQQKNATSGAGGGINHSVFHKFDVIETSYHLVCEHIDLHLCDDPGSEYCRQLSQTYTKYHLSQTCSLTSTYSLWAGCIIEIAKGEQNVSFKTLFIILNISKDDNFYHHLNIKNKHKKAIVK